MKTETTMEKPTLPTIANYGNYASSNYGAHCLRVTLPNLTVWFSYQTPVAFETDGKRVVRHNSWGPTTGKHLNAIDGGNHKGRVSAEEFEKLWSEMMA
jgi:hypothetical protein